jgi:hypothetical protein
LLAWLSREGSSHRDADPSYEARFLQHRSRTTLGDFIDLILRTGPTNNVYLVARNDVLSQPRLAPLLDDIRWPDGLLDPEAPLRRSARLWIGPAGTVTPLHCDNRHILLVQVYGRKRVKLISPFYLSAVYNTRECFSDVDAEAIDLDRFPAMRGVPVLEAVLEPGEALFLPVGWWHWVRALDVSISLSLLNFRWKGPEVVWRQAALCVTSASADQQTYAAAMASLYSRLI